MGKALDRTSRADTIVLLDDHDDTLEVLTETLRDEAYEVEGYTNPRHAMQRLLRPPAPRVAVIDYRMPGLNGLDVVRGLRAAGITIPIVIFSALDRQQLESSELAALSGVEVLSKPAGFQAMLHTIASLAPRK